ncbi:MAG: MarR family transcriptional regulator, partial [Eubacterium sp.]|nr:MarR family transcriptional regulator [Eubacterium sp.]
YIVRARSKEDERNVIIRITEAGEALKDRAVKVPEQMGKCMALSPEEAAQLYILLYKVLGQMTK